MSATRVSLGNRKSILTRHREPNDPELIEVSRDHAAISIEEYVAKIVANAPPLTETQKARISALLAPSQPADRKAALDQMTRESAEYADTVDAFVDTRGAA